MKFKKIVVKIGTSTVANVDDGLVNFERMTSIVGVLSKLKREGVDVVVVSSGAVGLGAGKLGYLNKVKTKEQKQACASVGQYALMNMYDGLFAKHGYVVSQILLPHQVLDGGENELNAKNTFEVLLKAGVVPIVNANDTVSTKELEFGDNDSLSAAVASLIEADVLIILTDIDGIYDANPRVNAGANLVSKIAVIDENVREMVKGSPGSFGTGGMETKLKAAEFLGVVKIPTAIINGNKPNRIMDVLEGNFVGTLIDTAGLF